MTLSSENINREQIIETIFLLKKELLVQKLLLKRGIHTKTHLIKLTKTKIVHLIDALKK